MALLRWEKVIERKGADKEWRAWPILLIARDLGFIRVPAESKASVRGCVSSERWRVLRGEDKSSFFKKESYLVI